MEELQEAFQKMSRLYYSFSGYDEEKCNEVARLYDKVEDALYYSIDTTYFSNNEWAMYKGMSKRALEMYIDIGNRVNGHLTGKTSSTESRNEGS